MTDCYSDITLHRLQHIELEILESIAEFCSDNDIDWFLDSGTALGAVRHKGFIPWDDDIDIGMLRDDYERFISAAQTSFPEGLTLYLPGETKNYACMFAKVCKDGTRFLTQETMDAGFEQGIFVDVFPYDALSFKSDIAAKQLKRARKWSRISYLYHSSSVTMSHQSAWKKAILKAGCSIAHLVLRVTQTSGKIWQNFEEARKMANGSESKYCTTLAYPYIKPISKDSLIPTIDADFEGDTFPIPHDWETYLVGLYGESWNELPPAEDRKTHAPLVLDFGNGINVLDQNSQA